jgi:small GTP-binding protein
LSLRKFFYKICIVGNSRVGKTTLLLQYLEKRFIIEPDRTIGSNFFVKYLKIPEIPSLVTLQVWDLAGQPHYRWVRSAFYKGAKGIIYVFDLTRKETFNNLLSWKEEVEGILGTKPNILVGNKIDLAKITSNDISQSEISTMKETLASDEYVETSAKLGTMVEYVFEKLTLNMYHIFDCNH